VVVQLSLLALLLSYQLVVVSISTIVNDHSLIRKLRLLHLSGTKTDSTFSAFTSARSSGTGTCLSECLVGWFWLVGWGGEMEDGLRGHSSMPGGVVGVRCLLDSG
jgi:hypothetical protein